MAKFEVVDKDKGIAFLQFESYKRLELTDTEVNGYVKFGKDNLYPNFLLDLYRQQSEHGAIVDAKASYLHGSGLKAKNEAQQASLDKFLDYANGKESWYDIDEKACKDDEIFNSHYIYILTDLVGRPIEAKLLQYANCRLSKCETVISYSDDWRNTFRYPVKTLNVYKKGETGEFFIPFKFYSPSKSKIDSLYARVPYESCLIDIATDTEIGTFNKNYISNGFSAGTLITFFNGAVGPKARKKLKEQLLATHSSPEKAGSIVLNFADKDSPGVKIDAINVDDLDKKFEFTSKRCQQKIITGHRVTNRALFGIPSETLFSRNELRDAYELMLNTYTKPRQKKKNAFLTKMCYLFTGEWIEIETMQLDPIGMDLANDTDLTVDERRELKGKDPLSAAAENATLKALNSLSPLVATKVLEKMSDDEIRALGALMPLSAPVVDANGLPIQQAQVNSTLTNLSGRQFQGLMRIVNKFNEGKLNEVQAVQMMVAGFGLTKEDAAAFLQQNDNIPEVKTALIALSKEVDDFILAQFEAIDTTETRLLELVSEEDVHFHNSEDALKHELSAHLKYAEEKSLSGSLLDKIKKIIGINGVPKTKEVIKEDGFKIELVTKYRYALKDDAPDLVKGGSSRPFCAKMMKLAAAGKEYTYEQIEGIKLNGLSNGMPEVSNIWNYRGGFYTHPGGQTTDPFCRHIWKAITYKVKTKI